MLRNRLPRNSRVWLPLVLAACLSLAVRTPALAAVNPNIWVATCPADSGTSAPGCGSFDSAPSGGQAPGFLAGQRSQPNYIVVQQDPWTGAAGRQTIHEQACWHWQLAAADKDPANAPGQVLTYPSVAVNYYQLDTAASGYTAPPPGYDLDHIASLTSFYNESMPAATLAYQAHAAYDIWLNNWATEVMVWNHLHGQSRDLSVDGDTKVGTFRIGGQQWTLWDSIAPGQPAEDGYYAWVNSSDQTSGTVDLLAMLEVMVGKGFIPAASSLTQVSYGWEISDTGGKLLPGWAIGNFGVWIRDKS